MSKTGNIEVRVCGCNKYCYPSESAAQRALNSYDDLVRYYECPDDNTYFHTTKAEKYVEITKTKDLEKKVENLELTIEGLERRLRTIGTINKKMPQKMPQKLNTFIIS